MIDADKVADWSTCSVMIEVPKSNGASIDTYFETKLDDFTRPRIA